MLLDKNTENITEQQKESYTKPLLVWSLFHIYYLASIYLFKVNIDKTRIICEIYSKLSIEPPKRHQLYYLLYTIFAGNQFNLFHLNGEIFVQIQKKDTRAASVDFLVMPI